MVVFRNIMRDILSLVIRSGLLKMPSPAARWRHIEMLWLSIGIILLSLALTVVDNERVAIRVLPQLLIPESCISKSWFGATCPGCGLTRSFVYLAEGNFALAWNVNRVGWIFALAVLVQIPYRTLALFKFQYLPSPRFCWWFGNVLIILLVANWLATLV